MIFFSLSLLFMYLFSYLTTVEFSKNLDEFLKVPVNFIFLSHWFLTWQSWEGNFSRTPMHLLSRLSAWLFLWWSSVNSLSLVVNSVKSSLIITRLIIIVSNWVNYKWVLNFWDDQHPKKFLANWHHNNWEIPLNDWY